MYDFDETYRAIYGKAVDWWSMGVLMYRMLLGQVKIFVDATELWYRMENYVEFTVN